MMLRRLLQVRPLCPPELRTCLVLLRNYFNENGEPIPSPPKNRKKKGYSVNQPIKIPKKVFDHRADAEDIEDAKVVKATKFKEGDEVAEFLQGIPLTRSDAQRKVYTKQTKELRARVYRKMFKPLEPTEICLLTWAEKEKIKFLHKSNPEEYPPSIIAQMFPISVLGATKLVKVPQYNRSSKIIKEHDEEIKKNIEKIQKGEIEVTPELEERLDMRLKIPFLEENVESSALTHTRPKILGEFERLVASPEAIKESDQAEEDVRERVRKVEEEEGDLRMEEEDPRYSSQLSHLGFAPNEYVTLGEFERRVREVGVEVPGDVAYLLRKEGQETPGSFQNEEEQSRVHSRTHQTEEKAFFRSERIQKFKKKEQKDVTVENNQGFIYSEKLGYQKPFQDREALVDDAGINISRKSRIKGSVYRVGDSFYDEDGSFLYKVV